MQIHWCAIGCGGEGRVFEREERGRKRKKVRKGKETKERK
jgi:hypothetical protein